jgi:hypothetical protein
MVEPVLLLVAGVIALALLVLIARNLVRMDRADRALKAPPPLPTDESRPVRQPPVSPLAPAREIPADRLEPTPSPVQFSAYSPKEAAPDVWQPLFGYVFRGVAAAQVRADALQQLGERADGFREADQPAQQPVATGALITATPVLDGFQINPPSQTIGFYEDWHRFDFKLRPVSAPRGLAVNGRLTFSVEGVIVADVPLSIFIGEPTLPAEPVSATRKAYDAIFCSYSRRDRQIVERVERAYRILGLDYLRDMISIRAGEDWNDALEKMIERADIFQLFWSESSAASDHVRAEWAYALSLANKPQNFIRPVFWQQPMPPVPPALQHIHFAYDETLDDA